MKEIVKSTRGTVHQYNDDSLDFKPYGKGEPVYDHSHKVGDSTLGVTKGKGKQSFVAKLKCDATETDPCEVMHQQLDKLAKSKIESQIYSEYDEQFQGFVILGIVFLILEVLFLERASHRKLFSNLLRNRAYVK